MSRLVAPLVLLLLTACPAPAETLPGPVSASVERVVDGDTIAVRARVWLDHDLYVLVRLRGIDAPELRGRCAEEKRRAVLAARFVADAISAGGVTLTDIEGDKYHGRVVADVRLDDGRDLAALLLESGTARRYDGAARAGWCAG